MTNEKIKEVFEEHFFENVYLETSRLHSPEFKTNNFNNLIVTLYGGLNGWGKSSEYFYDIYELINMLKMFGISAYVVNMDIDALDDVFKIELELRDLKELNKEKPE